jgi:phenylpyruvate tautomerase PptA (4-oxalocrotonate tautomerase family)
MPIADIEIVCASRQAFQRHAAQALADGIGRVLDAAPGTTWVRLRWLPSRQYAESGARWDEPVGPVFVALLLAHPPQGGALEAMVTALTAELARLLGVASDLVHLQLQPPATGRQAFGGRLVR